MIASFLAFLTSLVYVYRYVNFLLLTTRSKDNMVYLAFSFMYVFYGFFHCSDNQSYILILLFSHLFFFLLYKETSFYDTQTLKSSTIKPKIRNWNSKTMATKFRPLPIFFIFLCSFFFSAECRRYKAVNMTWWCNQTPHPETCNYFVSQTHQHFAPKHRSEFRRIMIHLALERALSVERQVYRLKPKCHSHNHRVVWTDCCKLHADTIVQLNRTLQGLQSQKGCTNFDAQTWMSTALTNIETCRTGSVDFNVSDFITPIMSSNLSELISNSLALNGVLLAVEDNNTEGFPRWFSRSQRRLLQSSSLKAKANLVVAQDGSGHFRTVQAALDAASKRRYGTRFIIHVKRGIYRENIEVGINNNNIWLVGDGLRSTIITSSRSVVGGYTTYSSATAGMP